MRSAALGAMFLRPAWRASNLIRASIDSKHGGWRNMVWGRTFVVHLNRLASEKGCCCFSVFVGRLSDMQFALGFGKDALQRSCLGFQARDSDLLCLYRILLPGHLRQSPNAAAER